MVGRVCQPCVRLQQLRGGESSLFHDLDVDLLHVHLLAELWWKFGAFQQLGIYACRHDCRYLAGAARG